MKIILTTLSLALLLTTHLKAKSSFGTVQFVDWSAIPWNETPAGALVINDEAAQKMWDALTNALVEPARPDLEQLTPAEISRDQVERRIGQHYICRNLPQFTEDGQALQKDEGGNVLYYIQCDLRIGNTSTGQIESNQTNPILW